MMEKDYLVIYADLSQAECYQVNKMSIKGLLIHLYKNIIDECNLANIKNFDFKIKKYFKTNNFRIKDIKSAGDMPIPLVESKSDLNKFKEFVFNLPQEIYNINKNKIKGVIFLVDEFQIIKELGEYKESFLWVLRSYIQNQNNVAYVFTGSMSLHDTLIYEISGKQGVFGGRMLTMELKEFSFDCVTQYLKEKAPDLYFTEEGLKRFYKCTSGIPAYINIFAKLLPSNEKLDEIDVIREFDNSLSALASNLINLWNRLTVKEKNIIITLINEPKRRKEIANELNVTTGSLSYSLNKLQNLALINYENERYVLAEPLLGRWITKNYEEKGIYPFKL